MGNIELIFLLCAVLIFYSYLGYGVLIFLLVKFSRRDTVTYHLASYPRVSLIIPFYNEKAGLRAKLENTLELVYPVGQLEIICVSDGSDDGSERIPLDFEGIRTITVGQRGGKFAAMKKAASVATGDILAFCDANTILGRDALLELMAPYGDTMVGAVTGEKRIITPEFSGANSKGEGAYWKYESFLKKYDSYFYSLVGGDGGLMSFRKELFEELPDDTILDDFMLTMRVAEKRYRVKYVPKAQASEYSSSSVKEEMKRKIRIAAGGWQSVSRLKLAINPFHDFVLTFQYVSHRVLRWTVVPFLLLVLFLLNHILVFTDDDLVWKLCLAMQYGFYGQALIGHWMREKPVPIPFFFVPYYFYIMNYCALLGFVRWKKGKQPVTWQKSERANEKEST